MTLTHLTHFELDGSNITDIGLSNLSILTALTRLKLSNIAGITNSGIKNLSKEIKHLNLSECENIIDLTSVSHITQRTDLNLVRCRGIKDLGPILIFPLIAFTLTSCQNIMAIKQISHPTELSKLNLSCLNLIYGFLYI